ncbi:MAG: uroporphyrinogen decarboxylase family protein [Planctomycetota bacterium]
MTPRERMLATLNHRMPDRVPIKLGWRPEVTEAMMQHYKVDNAQQVHKILDADLSRQCNVATKWPEWESRVNGELRGSFGNIGRTVLRDERTFEDPWGVVERVGQDGKYLEWMDGPFAKTDDLDSFDWPTEANIIAPPDLAARVKKFKDEGYWVIGSSGVNPFKQAWRMRGLENFLCDYVANPEWVEAIQERFLKYNLLILQHCAAAGVDMFEYWGDVAMQHSMMVSPKSWRRLDKQFWKRLISGTREVNSDVRFFFHSDGNVTDIIDDLIEIGFDILDPMQPESVNPAVIKAKWGSRITLCGGGSVQRTLPFGTVEDVRREVDFLMRYCAYDGGYIFRASNAVSFDCPIANVVAFYEMARDYDLSKIKRPLEAIPESSPCMQVDTTVSSVANSSFDVED